MNDSVAVLEAPSKSEPQMGVKPLKKSFKQLQFEIRELAILDATNRLLATKGYEQVVMEDIAAEVGIAKGSLYRHFQSKEGLAAAVMLRLLLQTHQKLLSFSHQTTSLLQLKGLLEWILHERLQGKVPHLPSASVQLREALMANKDYMNALMAISEDIGALIHKAKAQGDIRKELADEFVLYHFYSRTCDPTLEFLKSGGTMSDETIVQNMVRVTFEGLH